MAKSVGPDQTPKSGTGNSVKKKKNENLAILPSQWKILSEYLNILFALSLYLLPVLVTMLVLFMLL